MKGILGTILGAIGLLQLAIGIVGVASSVFGDRLLGGAEIILSLGIGALLMLLAAKLLRASPQHPAEPEEEGM